MKMRLVIMTALTLLPVFLSGISAAEKTYTFVGEERMVRYSTKRSETCDLAIRVSNPQLAGMRVTGLKVKVAPGEQTLENCSLWLSENLNLEKNEAGKKVNAPDVVSVDVTPDAEGWMTVKFATPYTLTAKGVYAGYSFTIKAYDSEKGQPIEYSQSRHEGGFYFHGTSSAVKWMDYEARLQGVLPVYLTIEDDFAEHSLGLDGLDTEYPYAQRGQRFSLPVGVWNISENAVSNFDYVYEADGYSGTGRVELPQPIEADLVNPSVVRLGFDPISELGNHSVRLTIVKVNGCENASAYGEMIIPVECRALVPVKRAVIEEATGTWCSACPRGIMAFEALNQLYGDNFIGIAYHGGNDPMWGGWEIPFNHEYFPSASLNRMMDVDPYYGDDNTQTKHFAIRPLVDASVREPALAAIDLTASTVEGDGGRGVTGGRLIDARAEVTFVDNHPEGGYRVAFVLIGNGLSGEEEWWHQSNSNSGRTAEELGPILAPLGELDHKIKGLIFNDVVLIAKEKDGVVGSLPEKIVANETMSVSYRFDTEEAKSAYALTEGMKLVDDNTELEVVALLLDGNGRVVNGAKCRVDGQASVNQVVSDGSATVVGTELYDFMGRRISGSDSPCVRIERMDDGSVRVVKYMKSVR